MKILRLSLFNIKKHKMESFAIIFLIMISMALLGIGMINYEKADRMFDESFSRTGSYRYIFQLHQNTYKKEYEEAVEKDERITRYFVFDTLQFDISTAMSYKKLDGNLAQFAGVFITEEDEKKLEKFEKNTPLSDSEIAGMEHPIWVPYYLKYNMGFTEGDDFVIVIGGKEYPFQIAGFYESGLMACAGSSGFKCVLTEADYDMMSDVVTEQRMIAFDTKDGVIESYEDAGKFKNEYKVKFEDIAGESVSLFCDDFYSEKSASTDPIKIIMSIVSFISVVSAASCLFMMRHKISNDIEDQMESIGVLEALGYRSKEISGAYIYEYLLLSSIGVLIGGLLIFLVTPFMTNVLQVTIGHDYITSGKGYLLLIPAALLILLTLITALGRARKIKKYPPVVAFRKGINTHHFSKNVLPVENTRFDINSRLGLKGLMSKERQNAGMFVCVLVASLAITFCIFLTDIFKDRGAIFLEFTGLEKALMVGFENGTDIEAVSKEIYEREDVRKCVLFRANAGFSINGNDTDTFQTFSYDDFGELESIHVSKGRYPLHDNEIMIGDRMAEKFGLSAGDNVSVKYNGIEKNFIISGTTVIFTNGGFAGYMTFDGFGQFMPPSECLNYLFVYPAEGVSEADLRDKLTDEYGSVNNTVGKSEGEGSFEERIKEKADEQMAILKSKYGVTNASYAIKVGDKIITGDSGSFKLTEISSFSESIDTQLGGISVMSQIFSVVLMIIVAGIVSIIMNFLINSMIKNERQAMGIEKAMGYTSKDLRKQIMFRMIPVAVPAVLVGSILALLLVVRFMKVAFGATFGINAIWVPVAFVIIALYVYATTYISAGKVKKVSVTELMTE